MFTPRALLRPATTLIMAAALGTGVLAGCGSSDTPAGQDTSSAPAAGSSVSAADGSAEASTAETDSAANSEGPDASGSATDATAGTAGGAAADLLPQAIRDKGILVVATDVSYPPFEFFDTDNTTIVGADPEFAAAIGEILGVEIDLQNTAFDGIVPGLAAGKFDMALSGLADTAERREKVTFVDYAANGAGFLMNTADTGTYTGYATLCGISVAVQSGTTMADDLVDASETVCTGAGKPAIEIANYKTQDEGVLALNSQRAKVMVTTGGSGAYIVAQTNGVMAVVMPDDASREASALGIAVGKDQPELAAAVQAAVGELIANGTYDSIMSKWGLADCCSNTKNTINDGN